MVAKPKKPRNRILGWGRQLGLQKRKEDKILDIGCGDKKTPGSIGLDKNYKEADIKIDVDEERLPYKNNTIQEIYFNDCLEHLGNPKFVLKECYRVLKKNGTITITMPNVSYILIRLLPIDWNKLWKHKLNTKRTGHLIHWTPDMLKMWLEMLKYKIIKNKSNSLFKYRIEIIAQK